jgi:hypothetical protein
LDVAIGIFPNPRLISWMATSKIRDMTHRVASRLGLCGRKDPA